MKCLGCGGAFVVDFSQMQAIGGGVVHANKPRCAELARAKVIASIAGKKVQIDPVVVELQSKKKEAQLAHRFSESRIGMILCCLEGKCQEIDEERMLCVQGCGRGLHGKACAQVSRARKKMGLFKCIVCRATDMQTHSCATLASISKVLQRSACQSMLVELTGGAESTAKNLVEFERLCKEWVAYMSEGDTEVAGTLIEPAYSEESFLSLLNWLVTDAGRARSFVTLTRSFGIALAKMKLTNWTAVPVVKAAIKTITGMLGLEPEPCALPSRRIIRMAIDVELPKLCKTLRYILLRSLFLLVLELMGGMRVGEATGAGEAHGLLANNCYLARPVAVDKYKIDEMLVAEIEDSKTTFGRMVVMCGVTRGELALTASKYLLQLCDESEIVLKPSAPRDGMTILRPDYTVVRISLLGMTRARMEQLIEALEQCTVASINRYVNYTIRRMREKLETENDGEEKKYVNIAGGEKLGKEVTTATAWVRKVGFAAFMDEVDGPLLRATDGKKITHMPLQPGSTYAHLSKSISNAYEVSRKMAEPDTELDLGAQDPDDPKFGNHWARRKADQVAQDTMEETETTPDLIDEYFGWNQKARKMKQQIHYRGRTGMLKLARITMML